MNQDTHKQAAARKAAAYVTEGMTVGLGSGSTVYYFIEALAENDAVRQTIKAAASSEQTAAWAAEAGIATAPFDEFDELDISVDGADEVDAAYQMTKGGGGALLREKFVNDAAKHRITIIDETKRVSELGAYPLPIEIVPYAPKYTAALIEALGSTARLRYNDTDVDSGSVPYVTDNGNYILDCAFTEPIKDPAKLDEKLQQTLGVVETGLFINRIDTLIIGTSAGVQTETAARPR
ncbi:ribose-5-phosphate isomerase RpiA [Salisediminibacterium halotolerans]|uniref:ribose-5-phosphate isomerase RpiA n=1 Tax=Salisediminibacterium halotolerans TaxID=517425 RepID=UPI000EAC4601|nr:ribose-5-phosphate isomerase RpiA [Salisediminibacterium halotolerans]RLJ75742.1 ribose-5-phosphate isomerase [Actinophytocola xinjiangensis]RPE89596.1 ribose-5-phosphate isomerase [Salisediminibacterium halotolerans]TWG36355.1 ribose-5-phosphate isomerase [Salisediminibacterium halotolerans]GEL09122.1 ribose-5-phosphate isomerase A [Salisediminibacterium halotolerans]